MRNPYAKPNRVLGVTDANWDAAILTARTWLQNHTEIQEVPDPTVRALWAPLADDKLWAQFKQEIGG